MRATGNPDDARRNTEASDEDVRDFDSYARSPRGKGQSGEGGDRNQAGDQEGKGDSIVSFLLRKGIVVRDDEDPGTLDLSSQFYAELLDKLAFFNEMIEKCPLTPKMLHRLMLYIVQLTLMPYYEPSQTLAELIQTTIFVEGLISPESKLP